MVCQAAGNDPRHGLVAVAHQHLFAILDELNMGAELRFQIADINGSHVTIILNVTMLVICYSTVFPKVPSFLTVVVFRFLKILQYLALEDRWTPRAI